VSFQILRFIGPISFASWTVTHPPPLPAEFVTKSFTAEDVLARVKITPADGAEETA